MDSVVAIVQAAPVAFDVDATLEVVRSEAAAAAEGGARLVVFPEAFVGGYPKGLDFGARVGSRSPEGREMFARYHAGAIDVPGPSTDVLCEIAAGRGVDLVIGVIEREGGTLYCTALFVGRTGQLLGKHRKLVPTAVERVIWGAGDGSTLPIVQTSVGRVGAAICWESYMPLLRMAMYAKGVEVYCAITVDDRDSWIPSMRHIAIEGRCFVVSACQYATRKDYPDDYPVDDVLIRGGSCIVDPFGELLAGPVYGERAIVRARIDPSAITQGKYDLDVTGHYARSDVFELHVDERPRRGVVRRRDLPPGQSDTTPQDSGGSCSTS